MHAMSFGSEVLGTSNAELEALRKLETALLRPSGWGRSREMLLGVVGDSAGFSATAALRRWAREIYDAACGGACGAARRFALPELRRLWETAAAKEIKRWGESRSPIDAATLEATRLGFKF